MIDDSVDDLPSEVADLIAGRRDEIARTAAQELGGSSVDELPHLLHRLAGKLGAFGHPDAGDAARALLGELGSGMDDASVAARVADLIRLLGTTGEPAA